MGRLLIGLAVTVMTAWGTGALYYSGPGGPRARAMLAAAFLATTALAFLVLPRRRRTLVGFVVVFAVLVAW